MYVMLRNDTIYDVNNSFYLLLKMNHTMDNRKKSREGVKQIPLGVEEEQVQQVAQELPLMHLLEVALPLWQEPGQIQGRLLR